MALEYHNDNHGINKMLGLVKDAECAFVVGGSAGAAIGAGIVKLINLSVQFDNAEFAGGGMEIPLEYPTVASAIAGAAIATYLAVTKRDNT